MEEEINLSSCYPTGCPPCVSPIEFPENPADGDKYCVVLDDTGTQKCWVWDKCVPGWRAEGQTDSPVRYRGGIDLTRTRASQYSDITAGDFFVVTVDANASTPANYPGLPSTVKAGERVVWSGNDWQVVTPIVAYAEEAQDQTPDPDLRIGGIVKLASVEEVAEGTNKCNPITPYTLIQAAGKLGKGEAYINDRFNANISETKVCIGDKLLFLQCEALALTEDDRAILTARTFTWKRGGVPFSIAYETIQGETSSTLIVEDYTIPGSDVDDTVTEEITCEVTFIDVWGNQLVVESDPVTVGYTNQLQIDEQPQNQSVGQGASVNYTFKVSNMSATLPQITGINYEWHIDGIPIKDVESSEANLGMRFINASTDTLTVTDTNNASGNYVISCEVTSSSNCSPLLESENALYDGPGSTSVTNITNVSNHYYTKAPSAGGVGSYALGRAGYGPNGLNGSMGRLPGSWRQVSSASVLDNSPHSNFYNRNGELYLYVRIS